MKNTTPFLQSALLAGLLAGALDGTAAVIILAKGNLASVFKYVASAVFGQDAFNGGPVMVLWGLAFHFLIALSFTVGYFCVYPHVPFLQKNKWVSGVLYGSFAWCFMNLLVVPMTRIPHRDFTLAGVLKNMVILIFCIGLPVAWLADRRWRTMGHPAG